MTASFSPGRPRPQAPGPSTETIETALAAAEIRQREAELAESRRQFNESTGLRRQELAEEIRMREADLVFRREQLAEQIRENERRFGLDTERFGFEQEMGRERLGLDWATLERQMAEAAAQRALERELGLGRLGLDRELGQGRLGLDWERLGLDRWSAEGQRALAIAELLSSLRGPENAFQLAVAQDALRGSGMPSGIQQVLALLQGQGRVPASLGQGSMGGPGPDLPGLAGGVPPQGPPGVPAPPGPVGFTNAGAPGAPRAPATPNTQNAAAAMVAQVLGNPAAATPQGNQADARWMRTATPTQLGVLRSGVEYAGGSWEDYVDQFQRSRPRESSRQSGWARR